jgi:MGT family glycosyltransferase
LLKIVYFGFPARSHTIPSLPLVRALVDRGADVEYYSIARFRALIESAGARFSAYPAICESLSAPTDLTGYLRRILDVSEEILPQLLLAHDRRPALLVVDASALWGRIVARRLAVASVASITTFAFTRSMLRMLGVSGGSRPDGWAECEGVLARLNRDYAASIRDPLDVMVGTGDLKVVYTSRLFQPAGRFLDQSHIFVGPLLDQRPREGALVAPSGPRPLAYISLGTIFNRNLDLPRRISETLSGAGWQVAVSLGDAGREDFGGWPAHVQVHAFVDQMAVLSQARLAVTHGGMGSVSEALAHAVPMIAVPQAVDQYLVARRIADCGAAVVVEPEAVSASGIEAALTRIEGERAGFVAAAARIGQSFLDVTPVSSAVERMLSVMNPE